MKPALLNLASSARQLWLIPRASRTPPRELPLRQNKYKVNEFLSQTWEVESRVIRVPRFLAAKPDAALIRLPWNTPLEAWPTQHLVALPRGISRHVVRFIQVGDEILAAKEILEDVAVHEYRQLTELRRLRVPSVEPVGVVLGRQTGNHDPLDPILLTRHLPFSLPYRALFYSGVKLDTVNRLLDAMVALFARLHLTGFYWGDVSLSNILFRRDAGEFAAYLVDAETGEVHPSLTDGQRAHDLQIARTNLFGEFCDLEAGWDAGFVTGPAVAGRHHRGALSEPLGGADGRGGVQRLRDVPAWRAGCDA